MFQGYDEATAVTKNFHFDYERTTCINNTAKLSIMCLENYDKYNSTPHNLLNVRMYHYYLTKNPYILNIY